MAEEAHRTNAHDAADGDHPPPPRDHTRGAPGEEYVRGGVLVSIGALLLGMLLAALDQTIVVDRAADHRQRTRRHWTTCPGWSPPTCSPSTAATPLWGKLGDQYGRKRLFQTAIVIFLIGSALCGMAQNMPQLIGFRALQGLGGGGLMVLSMAIVGDIVPPRERGSTRACSVPSSARPACSARCSAGCSPSTSAGAGSSTSTCPSASSRCSSSPPSCTSRVRPHAAHHRLPRHLPHRLRRHLPGPRRLPRRHHLGLGLAADHRPRGARRRAAASAFVAVERRAAEPVLPLKLFRIRTFTLCRRHQLRRRLRDVRRDDLSADVPPGRPGRLARPCPACTCCRWCSACCSPPPSPARSSAAPAAGRCSRSRAPASPRIGLLLLHQLDEHSSTGEMSAYFFVFGLGPRPGHAGAGAGRAERRLATRTSASPPPAPPSSAPSAPRSASPSSARSSPSRLGDKLDRRARRAARCRPASTPDALEADPRGHRRTPAALRPAGPATPYATAITDVFLYAAPGRRSSPSSSPGSCSEDKLRGSVTAPDATRDAGQQPGRALLVRRGAPRAVRARHARGAPRRSTRRSPHAPGYDLLPAASWLLLRIRRYGWAEPARARRTQRRAAERHHRGGPPGRGARGWPCARASTSSSPTEGREAAERLAAAREESLAELLGDWWGPDRPTDLVQLVEELNAELCGSDAERPASGGRAVGFVGD